MEATSGQIMIAFNNGFEDHLTALGIEDDENFTDSVEAVSDGR